MKQKTLHTGTIENKKDLPKEGKFIAIIAGAGDVLFEGI